MSEKKLSSITLITIHGEAIKCYYEEEAADDFWDDLRNCLSTGTDFNAENYGNCEYKNISLTNINMNLIIGWR